MTLKYIWRSFSLGCHFHVHFSYPWHAFASHSLPAIAELLVYINICCFVIIHRNAETNKGMWIYIFHTNITTSMYGQNLHNYFILARSRDVIEQWPFDTHVGILWVLHRNWICISSHFRDIGPWTYWGHDLDRSRSRDVIGHEMIWFSICGFLLVLYWNQAPISKRFRDIRLQRYLGHDLDLLGPRDVIGHVTIWYPI